MRWSWTLGRIAGIDTRIHATFLLLVAWVAAMAWASTPSWAAVAGSLVLITALFGSVFLHELGHALTARRYGIATRAITLLPIGGVAELEGTPRTPRAELVIALAGPAVNFVLAAGLWLAIYALGLAGANESGLSQLLGIVALANVSLGVFNLQPAFPMDGGRVLRALLQRSRGRLRATELASGLGRVLAVGMGVLGLVGDPWLVVIAVFVWLAAGRELAAVRERAKVERLLQAARARGLWIDRPAFVPADYEWGRGRP